MIRFKPSMPVLGLCLLAFTACSSLNQPATPRVTPNAPPQSALPNNPSGPLRGLGGFELEFTGIGADLQSRLTRRSSGVGTLSLGPTSGWSAMPLSQGTFVKDNVRYLSATFKVTPSTSLSNLTFMGESKAGTTLFDTALLRLRTFAGADINDAAKARTIMPTHGMTLTDLNQQVLTPMEQGSSFQAFSETDLAGYAPSDGGELLPWGFVAATSAKARTLTPTEPGYVTFAFKMPSAGTSDPYSLSVFLEAVTDPVTRVTESLEEQGGTSGAGLRASSTGASQLNLFPSSTLEDSRSRVLCSLRTAGSAASPSGYLFTPRMTVNPTVSSPSAGAGSASPSGAVLSAFTGVISNTSFDKMFVKSGFQTYPASTLSGGKLSVTKNRFAGEELEVSLPSSVLDSAGAGLCRPYVYRFRTGGAVASGLALKNIAPDLGAGANPQSVAMGDVNNDGVLDMATANAGNATVSVFLGNGDGSFGTRTDLSTGTNSNLQAVALLDYNRDGKLDLGVASASTGRVLIFQGQGDGSFGSASVLLISSSASPQALAVGDLNGDGLSDLVTVNGGSANVTVFLNGPAYNFPSQKDSPAGSTGNNPQALALGDLNGDGALDVVTANAGANTISVLLGKGNGTFSSTLNYSVGLNPQAVAFGDFDGDGKPDVVIANRGGNMAGNVGTTVSVLRGNGNGTLQAKTDYTVGNAPQAVATADLDGDGRLDIVTANISPKTISVLRGQAGGGFLNKSDFSTNSGTINIIPQALALGDFDGDGKPDVATAGSGSSADSVALFSSAVSLNPSAVVLAPSSTALLKVVGTPWNAPSWSSSNTAVATISNFNSIGASVSTTSSIGSATVTTTVPGLQTKVLSTSSTLLGALDLTGASSYATVPDNANLDLEGNFSLEVWVRIPSGTTLPAGDLVLLEKRSSFGSAYPYSLKLDSSRRVRFDLRTSAGTGQTVSTLSASNQTPLSDGNWHHLAVTSTLSGFSPITRSLQLFVDGVPVDSDSQSNAVTTTSNTAPLSLGAAQDGSLKAPVQIDEVRLWNVTRSDSEIASAYNAPLATPYSTNLTAYFKMNQINALTLNDERNPNLDGALQNMTGLELVAR